MEEVVVVNKKDQVLGEKGKAEAHKIKGALHRGFMALIFNKKGEILLLKRSQKKRLWPLFWDGCCSHPRLGESFLEAGERRLKEELDFTCKLKYVDKFYYRAVYQSIGSEEEVCAVLTGIYNGKISPNPDEVADYRFVDFEKLGREIKEDPQLFTPWLKKAVRLFEVEKIK